MTNNTYYIDGQIPMVGNMLCCQKCGRKILVEIAMCGVSHNLSNLSIAATCGECLRLGEAFKQSYPSQAEKIEKWLDSPVKGT
jgi:hypothetical protein